MRLKRASITFAGAAAAVAVTTMAASPAWACSDRDPALKLKSVCGKSGQPDWMLTNPNTWGGVPFTWSDNAGDHTDRRMIVPAGGSIALPTHASKITVVAYRPDKPNLPVWRNHGATGVSHCVPGKSPVPPSPVPPSHKPPSPTPPSHKPPSHKPSSKPPHVSQSPVTPPTGEARPATPVKTQPAFTG